MMLANRLALAVLLAALMVPTTAVADEVASESGPLATTITEADLPTGFHSGLLELLPLDDLERSKAYLDHGSKVYRIRAVEKRAQKLQQQLGKSKGKARDKARVELARARASLKKQYVDLLQELVPYGVTPQVLELVADAPRGGKHQLQRYAFRLPLALDDLTVGQRELITTVLDRIDGAWLSLAAQKKRLQQRLAQTELDKADQQDLLRSFDRQEYQMERRYWRFLDYVLSTEQMAAVADLLPRRYTKKQNAIEHLYTLPGLTPSQGTRLKALVTELDAENAPEQAAIKRLQQDMKKKGLEKSEREALRKELQAAQQRQLELLEFSAESMKAVLTDKQYEAYKAIPPRLSPNDRRETFDRAFKGVPLTPQQDAELKALRRAYQKHKRDLNREIASIRKQGAAYGPDSPQQGMMEMMMAGVAAEGMALQHEAMGRLLLEILTEDQTSAWVLGHYGRIR